MSHLFGWYRNFTLCLSDQEDEGIGNLAVRYAQQRGRCRRQNLLWRLGQRNVLGRKGLSVCRYQLASLTTWDEVNVDGVDGEGVKLE